MAVVVQENRGPAFCVLRCCFPVRQVSANKLQPFTSPGVLKHFEGAPCGQWGMGRVVALTGGLPLYSLLHCLDSERGQRHSDGLDGVGPPRAELTMSPAGHAGGSSTPWALFSHE